MRLRNLFRKPGEMLKDETVLFYELLFCDDIALYRRQMKKRGDYPWDILFAADSGFDDLRHLVQSSATESRVKILACRRMMENGWKIGRKELLGVIVEVGLENGNDVLAAFQDGSTRYINQSGKVIVWDVRDRRSDMLVGELFYESEMIVKQVGPWDKQQRLPKPRKGLARISFLMSDGLYFGQAPVNDLFNDPIARPALNAATLLMQHIIRYSQSPDSTLQQTTKSAC